MDIPDAYRILALGLEGEGFETTRLSEWESFGDRSVELERENVRVRLSSDRGWWSLEAQHIDWGDDWFLPEVWHGYLTGKRIPSARIPRKDQVALFRRDLGRICQLLVDSDAGLRVVLSALQEDWVMRGLTGDS